MFKFLFAGIGIVILLLGGIFAGKYFFDQPSHGDTVISNSEIPGKNSNPVSTPVLDSKTGKDAKLQAESDKLLNLFGKMPSVPVFVRDEAILKKGSETQKSVGYTTCENSNQPFIFIKKVFYERANEKQLTNILKHELVHAWFCRQGIQAGHDERFRQKFKEVGGVGN